MRDGEPSADDADEVSSHLDLAAWLLLR